MTDKEAEARQMIARSGNCHRECWEERCPCLDTARQVMALQAPGTAAKALRERLEADGRAADARVVEVVAAALQTPLNEAGLSIFVSNLGVAIEGVNRYNARQIALDSF